MGLSLGQNCFAMDLLMTTTGAESLVSLALMSRPCNRGMCMARIYPGVVTRTDTSGCSDNATTGCPSMATGWFEPPSKGKLSIAPADSTPGKERTR
jgi:hypothetical protein